MGIKHIFNPELFQGYKKRHRYFEGWYFKFVTKDGKYALALIPGVSINRMDPHLFIQVYFIQNEDKTILETHYLRYDYHQIFYHPDRFEIKIGDSIFTKDRVFINISKTITLKGVIDINQRTPIKKSLVSPNIMGFFGYLNFMECYHGVISMSHVISGKITYQDKEINFDSGKGYLEKDWGKSFPKSYVWIQSNHFDDDASFMFSYANIPFIGLSFKGLISVLIIQGKEYRFATYNFSRVIIEKIEPNKVEYVIKKGKFRLEVIAKIKSSIDLVSPKDGVMNQTIKEGLSGHVDIKLYERQKLIYEGHGIHSGIEIMKK